jgi:phosphoglycolate phosphatase-like HAD superfamily hydrolase
MLVGDSAVDLATARNARARICLARYGFGYRFSGDEFNGEEAIIDSPGELLRLLGLPESP